MKHHEVIYEQLNGRMIITIHTEGQKPIVWSRSTAPSMWDEWSTPILIQGLRDVADELEKRVLDD